jgi:hypothetical protein
VLDRFSRRFACSGGPPRPWSNRTCPLPVSRRPRKCSRSRFSDRAASRMARAYSTSNARVLPPIATTTSRRIWRSVTSDRASRRDQTAIHTHPSVLVLGMASARSRPSTLPCNPEFANVGTRRSRRSRLERVLACDVCPLLLRLLLPRLIVFER